MLDSLIYLHIIGGVLCLFSFLVFISGVKVPNDSLHDYDKSNLFEDEPETQWEAINSVSTDIDELNTSNELEYEELYAIENHSDDSLADADESIDTETEFVSGSEISEKKGFFNRLFMNFNMKNKKRVEDEESFIINEEIHEPEEEILLGLEDDFDEFFDEEYFDSEVHQETVIEENLDEEVFEDFPHEKLGITIFSKEEISEEEIGDLKVLITTIKEEFRADNKVTVKELLEDEKIENRELSDLDYEKVRDSLL